MMGILGALVSTLLFFAAMPATTTYKLNSYGFGSGGTAGSSTSAYALEGISGEIGGQTSLTAAYETKPGFTETQQANVPKISSFNNNSGLYYNKLHFVIDQQGNPTDSLYALQISTTSNFSSSVFYVQPDMTLTSTLVVADYQTYATWGGGIGANIIGLNSNTTYYLRAKATQGKFTESAWGPSLSATTANPSLSFSITNTSINIGSLLLNTVVSAPSTIDITLDTNAASGADVYIYDQNSGLLSSFSGSHTLPSSTGDLSVLAHGYGAQITAVSVLTKVSPYDGSTATSNVGVLDTTIRRIFTASAPVSSGSGTVTLKAKASADDRAATDYSDLLTMLASASF